MPKEPVILLTFANQRNAHLANLKKESSLIEQALAKIVDQGAVRLWRDESTQVDDLIKAFNRFDGEINIFHYGGHAQPSGLEFEDQEGLLEGVAQHLSQQKQLKLVFLNGCSTKPLVERILQLGAFAVIGTHRPINDEKATIFAGYFYDKLANLGNIKQAFEYASNCLRLIHKDLPSMVVRSVELSRGIQQRGEEPQFPWGLFYNSEYEEVLNWTLPAPSIRLSKSQIEDIHYEVNDFFYPVLEEMAAYVPKIKEEFEKIEDEREAFEMIIKNFPWNIGSQFGLLVTEKKLNENRIEQILSTYIACGQWLYFVPLSQLWQARMEEKIRQFKGRPHEAFTIRAENFLHYDYIGAFCQVLEELENHQVPLFVVELDPLAAAFKKGGELYEAHLVLESVRKHFNDNNLPKEGPVLDQMCLEAEFALAQLLSKLAFMVRYQMVTVREIVIFNPRHLETKYFHKIGRLNAHTDDRLFFFKQPKSFDEFLENDSVLLLKDADHIDQYLSLSPFFIDRNAYLDKNADLTALYTYGFAEPGRTPGSMTFKYLKSSRNLITAFENKLDQLSTAEEKGSRLKETLQKRRGSKPKKKPAFALLQEQFDQLLELLQ